MTDLLLAAPPPAQPAPNYFEIIGIPLLVAVVTATITSWLGAKREHTGRLAALRLETYSELVRHARRWRVQLKGSNQALKDGKKRRPHVEELLATTELLYDQLSILHILAKPKNYEKIDGAFQSMLEAVMSIDHEAEETRLDRVETAQDAVEEFVRTVVAAGRTEVRSTKV